MPPRQRNHVNNEADPAFTAAVAQAVADLLPTLTARITDEICQNKNNGNNGNRRNARRVNTEGSRNDGNAQPTVEAENWIAHIEKIFEVLGCGDQFKAKLATYKLEGDAHSWWRAYKKAKEGDAYVATLSWNDFRDIFFLLAGFLEAKAGTQEEQAKHFKWGLNDFILDRILNTEFTDVAHVANAARNVIIFCDRPKNKGNKKTDRDGHRIRPSDTPAQGSNQRAYDQRDSDIYGNGGRYGNRDRISRFRVNSMVVLMGHRARGDTQIMPHLPRVPFVGNFIRERRVTGLLVLALNVEKLDIWLKIVRKVPPIPLDNSLSLSTPMLKSVIISHEFRNYPLRVREDIRFANLLPLKMSDFDIILGMDWLTEHRATIDFHSKCVNFGDLNNLKFIYHGSRPGFPPEREVKFTIELIPGAQPISKAPY
nr:hypothetical protein [Tanacetum cinerariifolium]